MKNTQQIIDAYGGFEAVRYNYLRIENPPFMPLVIEVINGPKPDGSYEISVAHYGQQNGDVMRDPEMTFAVSRSGTDWRWSPLTFTNDYLGCHQVAGEYDSSGVQRVLDGHLQGKLKAFAANWDENLQHQGFIEAFPSQCPTRPVEAILATTPAPFP